MKMTDALEVVFSTFFNNKLRTLLTVIAISIGMAAIIVLVSFGFGLQKLTLSKISSSDALLTYSLTSGNSNILKMNSQVADKIKALPQIDNVGLSYAFSGHLAIGDTETDSTAYAVDQNYLSLESLRYLAGKEYSNDDDAKSLIISKSASEALGFSKIEDAIDKEVKVTIYYDPDNVEDKQAMTLKIAAVTEETTSNIIYVPIKKLTVPQGMSFSTIKAKIKDTSFASSARSEFESMGLSIYSVAETIQKMNQVFEILRYVLFGFGLIALLVASLGMFNTLTISLLERTREIGIMRVLGATASDIKKIFLLEAVFMGAAGGFVGVMSGWLIGVITNVILTNLAQRLGGEPVELFYTPMFFIGAIIVSSLVIGFMTGFYPAGRAAKIDPLNALRYE